MPITMQRLIPLLFITLALIFSFNQAALASEKPHVLVETNLGSFELELFPDQAPKSVANFLEYVNSGPTMNVNRPMHPSSTKRITG